MSFKIHPEEFVLYRFLSFMTDSTKKLGVLDAIKTDDEDYLKFLICHFSFYFMDFEQTSMSDTCRNILIAYGYIPLCPKPVKYRILFNIFDNSPFIIPDHWFPKDTDFSINVTDRDNTFDPLQQTYNITKCDNQYTITPPTYTIENEDTIVTLQYNQIRNQWVFTISNYDDESFIKRFRMIVYKKNV